MTKIDKLIQKFTNDPTKLRYAQIEKILLYRNYINNFKMLKHFITLNNKQYSYTLKKNGKELTHVHCEAANISQDFPNEDIPGLLEDLGNLIIAEKEYQKKQEQIIRFRISAEDKKRIEKNAVAKGYKSVSSFLRDLALKKA